MEPTFTATSTTQLPSQFGPTMLGKGEQFNVQLPGGQTMSFQLPAELPGARTTEWKRIPEERLPIDLPFAPPGYKVVQYERDIEIDLANLNLTPVYVPCTPITTQVYEPCKPEILTETTTVPPTQLETTKKEILGGEEVVSVGPHGEKIKTKVTALPEGGERIETKVRESLTDLPEGENIKTRTTIKECGGGTTTVETSSKLVPPEKVVTEPMPHHHMHEEEPRKGKFGHHHHDTSLGGLIRGAFGSKHGEHTPKETM